MTVNQLTGLDTAFLCLDGPSSPMNLGAVATFCPRQPVHPTRLVALLCARAERIPRLRQRVRPNWFPPGGAHWADDPNFSADRHVFAHRLPRPHQSGQLAEVASKLMSKRLDTDKPLWELHVITGLPGGQFAVLAKMHHALADGTGAVLLGLSLMDGFDTLPAAPAAPSPPLLPGLTELRETFDIASSVVRGIRPPARNAPLFATPSKDRRLVTLRLDLNDIKRVRLRHGGTTNDVLLAVLSGALHEWLRDRGHRTDEVRLRALIPVSQRRRVGHLRTGANHLSGYLCTLPVAERDPLARLRAVRASMDANKEAGPYRGAGALPILADRLPGVLHRIATPFARPAAPLLFDTVVTNVPLPSIPLSCDGAELREVYPVVPLAPGQALGVAFCSYRGVVHIGLTANSRTLPDVDRLGDAVPGTLAALHELCA